MVIPISMCFFCNGSTKAVSVITGAPPENLVTNNFPPSRPKIAPTQPTTMLALLQKHIFLASVLALILTFWEVIFEILWLIVNETRCEILLKFCPVFRNSHPENYLAIPVKIHRPHFQIKVFQWGRVNIRVHSPLQGAYEY